MVRCVKTINAEITVHKNNLLSLFFVKFLENNIFDSSYNVMVSLF